MLYPNPSYYSKEITTTVDKTLGYEYFMDKNHPLADKKGRVYYHRHVYSVKIGKWVDPSYHVHHKDENRLNNDPNNLEGRSPGMHATLHNKDRGYSIRRVIKCKFCNKSFISKEGRVFCSNSCSSSNNNVGLQKLTTEEELSELVWEMPTTKIAEMFGCSDQAVSKLCKKWGIEKPPRGYWAKLRSKK